MYVKCPSGTANLQISANTITNFTRPYEVATNMCSIGGDITQLSALTTFVDYSNNTLSGDISLLTSITYLLVWGSNTLTGDITSMTGLTYLALKGSANISGSVSSLTSLTHLERDGTNTLSGSISGLTSLDYIQVAGTNTLSGSVASLTGLTRLQIEGSNTVTGSISALTSLTYILMVGSNTISGDLNGLASDLTTCDIRGSNQIVDYTSGATWGNATVRIVPATSYGYSATEVDNILIDMAASDSMDGKTITLTGSSAARTSASDAAVTKLETVDSGYVHAACTVVTN